MADTFAVFGGGAGITNQGLSTVITGDMGTPGIPGMITGFHDPVNSYTETPLNVGAVSGEIYTDAPPPGTPLSFGVAQSVATDALAAYNFLAAVPNGIDPGAGQLGGLTLAPGVYKSASGAFLLTGSDLTLDAQGNPDAVWIFQMASTLTVGTPGAARSIILANGAQVKNVYWQVGSAAIINAAGGGTMVGTIIASSGIVFSTAGKTTLTALNGRALALFASITMVNTVISAYGAVGGTPVVVPAVSHIAITGTNSADVVPAVNGNGFITAMNNGGHIAATLTTVTGTGAMNITNNTGGGAVTATLTGEGTMTITNSGSGALTVTNIGNGTVTINSTATDAVTITNTGNGDVAITASGIGGTFLHTGDVNVSATLP
jgi:hypothetical protein